METGLLLPQESDSSHGSGMICAGSSTRQQLSAWCNGLQPAAVGGSPQILCGSSWIFWATVGCAPHDEACRVTQVLELAPCR